MQHKLDELKQQFSVDFADSYEDSEGNPVIEVHYLNLDELTGYSIFSFSEPARTFEWLDFYPRKWCGEEPKGIGTLAQIETLLWAIEKYGLKPEYLILRPFTTPPRKEHLAAMGIKGTLPLDEYLQKSLNFAKTKFGWEYENPFEQ